MTAYLLSYYSAFWFSFSTLHMIHAATDILSINCPATPLPHLCHTSARPLSLVFFFLFKYPYQLPRGYINIYRMFVVLPHLPHLPHLIGICGENSDVFLFKTK